jgi:dTDP-6-deoxy-L-talose 4-dehydrogenase (NAD+)
MRILLTGATGFIGSSFLKKALRAGHHIAGLILPGQPVPTNLPNDPRLIWMWGTLADPPWNEIAGFGAETCVHGAWIVTPGICLESPENRVFLQHSLSFLRRLSELGTRHLVGLGTCIEYQITSQRLSEDHTPVVPTTVYARCKNELRLALEAQARERDQTLCWARIFYPYGPGESPERLCSYVLDRLHCGEPVLLKTPQSTKDYIHITDLAAALLTVVEQRFHGTINLGTGVGSTVSQIAKSLAHLLGRGYLIREADPPEHDPFPFVVADATKLHRLRWTPQTTLEAGLHGMVAAYTNRPAIEAQPFRPPRTGSSGKHTRAAQR